MGRASPESPDLDITDPVLYLDFVETHTFCVPEDPASLLIDRLAGRWVIKNFSRARARSAATCRGRPALELDARGNFSTSTEIRKCPRGLSFRCPQPAADSQRISSTNSSTTCGTEKSTICLQCAAESASEKNHDFNNWFLSLKN